MATFTDVPTTHTFYHEIEAVYAAGLMIGTQVSPAVFSPDTSTTVAQYWTGLARAVHWKDNDITESDSDQPQMYTDVSQVHWAYKWVQKCAKLGITAGEPMTSDVAAFGGPGNCGEAVAVKRKWAAVWIIRSLGLGKWEPAVARFTDVPTTHYLYGWIEHAAKLGITIGTSATTFSPEDTFTRGQMAAFLVRAYDVPYVTGPNGAGNVEQ